MLLDCIKRRIKNFDDKTINNFFEYFNYNYSFDYDESARRYFLKLKVVLKETDYELIEYLLYSNGREEYSCFICDEYSDKRYNNACEHIDILISKFYSEHEKEILEKFDEFDEFESNRNLVEEQRKFDSEFDDLINDNRKNQIKLVGNKVSLEIRINSRLYDYETSFYVGYAKKYKIQDYRGFIRKILEGSFHRYGKELSFVHDIDAFDDYSKTIINYIIKKICCDSISYISNLNSSLQADLVELSIGKHIVFDDIQYRVLETPLDIKFALTDDFKLKIIKNSDFDVSNIIFGRFYKNDKNKTIQPFLNSKELMNLYKVISKHPSSNIKKQIVSFKNNFLTKYPDYFECDEKVLQQIKNESLSINTFFDLSSNSILCSKKLYKQGKEIDESTIKDCFERQLINDHQNLLDFYGFHNFVLDSSCDVTKFLNSTLEDFKHFGDVFVSENILNKKKSLFKAPIIKIDSSGSILDIVLEPSSYSEEELLKIYIAIKRKKKFILLDDKFINLSTEESDIFADEVDNFKLVDGKKIKTNKKAPLYYAFKNLDSFKNVSVDNYVMNALSDIKNFINSKISNNLIHGDLRDYQIEGIKWLKTLFKYGLGGILADDMGLGKTIQIIGFLNEIKPKNPVLIVCPKSLVFNWMYEFQKFSPESNVIAICGNSKERKELIKLIKGKTIVLISYDTLRIDIDNFTELNFDCVFLDEAQYIKNTFAKKTSAVKKINSSHKYALTGTPIENNIYDLWSIFDFLMPDYLQPIDDFNRCYEKNENYVNVIKLLISPFILRRKKSDVLKQLPEKYELYISCEMKEEQRKIYESFKAQFKRQLEGATSKDTIQILSFLTRMRQICVDPSLFVENYTGGSGKVNTLLEIVDEKIAENHRILIFSQFVSALDVIKHKLKEKSIKFYSITGETPAKERVRICDDFNDDSSIKVVLISLKAGGTGLNLVGADTVIHLDPWWNLAAENQASDRAHRIGQVNNVEIIKLVAENSIEQKVIKIQNEKKKLVDSIIAENDQSIKNLSLNEIKSLIF